MRLIPFQLFSGQKAGEPAGFIVLSGHLLVEIPVIFHDAVHGRIQFLLEIRAVFVDAKIGFRKPHLAYRQHIRRISIGVQRHQSIDLAALQHGQQFRGLFCQLYNFRMDAVFLRPFYKLFFLNVVFADADPLSVKG